MVLRLPIPPVATPLVPDQDLETFEVRDNVTYDRLFYDVARPLITIYVDPSLPYETIRTANPFNWPSQPIEGRVYHVDPKTWYTLQHEYMLVTGCKLSDLPFIVKYINTNS